MYLVSDVYCTCTCVLCPPVCVCVCDNVLQDESTLREQLLRFKVHYILIYPNSQLSVPHNMHNTRCSSTLVMVNSLFTCLLLLIFDIPYNRVVSL